MFLVQSFILYLKQFKHLIYHERIQRYKPNIELTHKKNAKNQIVSV